MVLLSDMQADWTTLVAQYSINAVYGLVIFAVGYIVAKIVRRLVSKILLRRKVDVTITLFLTRITYVLILIMASIMALSKWGVPVSSLIALLSVSTLAIGLSLKSSLANFASGLILIVFRPIKVGDYIESGAGASGTVKEIEIMYTKLQTPQNQVITVPNSKLMDNKIINYSLLDTRRNEVVVGISYDDDLKKAKTLLETLLTNDERVLQEPKPLVAVQELAESSVNLLIRYWTLRSVFERTKLDLIEAIKTTFDANGIHIPYPQRDVHHYHVTDTRSHESSGD